MKRKRQYGGLPKHKYPAWIVPIMSIRVWTDGPPELLRGGRTAVSWAKQAEPKNATSDQTTTPHQSETSPEPPYRFWRASCEPM
jgi:hypothetical protein